MGARATCFHLEPGEIYAGGGLYRPSLRAGAATSISGGSGRGRVGLARAGHRFVAADEDRVPARPGGRLATPEKALVDFLYLTPARSRLFRALPELEWSKTFRRSAARSIAGRIEPASRRRTVTRRLEGLLGRRRET